MAKLKTLRILCNSLNMLLKMELNGSLLRKVTKAGQLSVSY